MPLPTQRDILDFLSASEQPATKRELARAFDIKGDARAALKELLRKMEKEGLIVKQGGKAYGLPEALPSVGVVEVYEIDLDGDVFARPTAWDEDVSGPPPRIEIMPGKRGHSPLKEGDRALVRLSRIDSGQYEGRVIRRLDEARGRVLGLVGETRHGYTLQPTDKKAKHDFEIESGMLGDAGAGDLAIGEIMTEPRTATRGRPLRRKKVRIVEVLGRRDDPKAISLIALHECGLRADFPGGIEEETAKAKVPPLEKRKDLRRVPLVTIDGADARDFDDAVFAEETEDGFHLVVAIADVAYYVRPDTALDREACRRGNSTYFPDRVVPMLPEALSNDLCSLRPREDRACMGFDLWIDQSGRLIRHQPFRGLMRSAARLTYEQVQAARDGAADDVTDALMDTVISPLYAAYDVLKQAREDRGALALDLPERQILLDENGTMSGVRSRPRLDSHCLIEEFMILANVAAAQTLEARKSPCVYRIHDRPSPEKLSAASEFLKGLGLSLPKGQVIRPAQLNQVLHKGGETAHSHLISDIILRTQSQAVYHPENIGHFGLALERYAHFTSPIRRYADLLVHRALIKACMLGPGGLSEGEEARLEEISAHISQTERTSMEAERAAIDRFTAAWLEERIGAEFSGRINGVTRFGLFVTLDENGADGLVPMRSLPDDFYVHDEHQHALIGRQSGRIYRLGAPVTIRIREADGLTGSTIFEIIGDQGADIPGASFRRPPQQGKKPRMGSKKRPGERKRRRTGRPKPRP